jgi:hypothetical protein
MNEARFAIDKRSPLPSFRRKPESRPFPQYWIPGQARDDDQGRIFGVAALNPNSLGNHLIALEQWIPSPALAPGGRARTAASARDTGGIDGPEDNAGAMVLPDTPARTVVAGIDLRARLTENDACGVFASPGDLVVTGPTRTNVNDFRAILIDKTESQAGEK